MARLVTTDLVAAISQLGTSRVYSYVSGVSKLRLQNVRSPNGPVEFMRWKNDTQESTAQPGKVSRQQLARIALICSNKPNYPLHVDRLFSGGGNSRSALETLLAYTPHFFMCYPQRVDSYTGEVLTNLKHILWCPDEEHPWGEIAYKPYQETITEFEVDVDFGYIGVTEAMLGSEFDSIEAKRIHTQMQIALVEIGNALNFRTWIAKNDHHIPVKNTTLGKLNGVIQSLDSVDILYRPAIKDAALLVDCIWFTQNGDRIPAIIEIEHSTGVTSGMTRMQKLRSVFPSISTTFTVVAPNNFRNKVVQEANNAVFRELNARFMPYSTVRELYGLVQRYRLANVVDHTFVEPFMERIVTP